MLQKLMFPAGLISSRSWLNITKAKSCSDESAPKVSSIRRSYTLQIDVKMFKLMKVNIYLIITPPTPQFNSNFAPENESLENDPASCWVKRSLFRGESAGFFNTLKVHHFASLTARPVTF